MADDLSATIEQLRGMGLLHVGDARLSSDDIARMQVELLRPPQRRHAQEFEDVHDGSGMGDHSDSSHARGGAYSSGSLADTNNGDGSPSAYSRSLSTGVGQTQSHGSPAPAKPSASAGQLSSKQQQRQQQLMTYANVRTISDQPASSSTDEVLNMLQNYCIQQDLRSRRPSASSTAAVGGGEMAYNRDVSLPNSFHTASMSNPIPAAPAAVSMGSTASLMSLSHPLLTAQSMPIAMSTMMHAPLVPASDAPPQDRIPSECAPDAIKLFIGNIPKCYSVRQLLPHFETIGRVSVLIVCLDKCTNQSKGSGFVWYTTRALALRAIEELDGKLVLPDPTAKQPPLPLVVRRARQPRRGDAQGGTTPACRWPVDCRQASYIAHQPQIRGSRRTDAAGMQAHTILRNQPYKPLDQGSQLSSGGSFPGMPTAAEVQLAMWHQQQAQQLLYQQQHQEVASMLYPQAQHWTAMGQNHDVMVPDGNQLWVPSPAQGAQMPTFGYPGEPCPADPPQCRGRRLGCFEPGDACLGCFAPAPCAWAAWPLRLVPGLRQPHRRA